MKTQSVRRVLRATGGAVLAGALGAALTGCGQTGPMKMGAAATVGGERITTAQLEQAAKEWRATAHRAGLTDDDLQQVAPQLSRTMVDPTYPERSVLFRLIDFRVVEELARSTRINVTPGQVDKTIETQGGRQRIDVEAFKYGLPPSQTRALITRDLRLGEFIERSGVKNPYQLEDKLREALSRTARGMKLSVNPRFGSFDYRQFVLGPVCTGLSKGTWDGEEPPQGLLPPQAQRRQELGTRPGCHPLVQPQPGGGQLS